MAKPFDISKFRKDITKSIDGLSIGFNDPTDWISTGNFALNYLISGDFNKGIPLGKVTVFAGESGAGKSYFCSGNIIKNAQAFIDAGGYAVWKMIKFDHNEHQVEDCRALAKNLGFQRFDL